MIRGWKLFKNFYSTIYSIPNNQMSSSLQHMQPLPKMTGYSEPVVNGAGNSSSQLLQDDSKLVQTLTESNIDEMAIHGSEILKDGGVIGIPTDTIYGLAADAQSPSAISRLYHIKGRDFSKPIAICVSEIDDVYKWSNVTISRDLLEEVLPGPITLVFHRQQILNPSLNPNTNLIGIRIPNYVFTRKLAYYTNGPIALTSANPSSFPSTISPHEFKSLWNQLDAVYDGGQLGSGTNAEGEERSGSTVIDFSIPGKFSIIRAGTAFKNYIDLLQNKYSLIHVSRNYD